MAELLAPAGSLDHVLSAIDAGADAVYLGGKSFNARKFAHNLSDEELAEAVRIAHVFGVRIYVTVNIVMADKELKALTGYLKYLDSIGVDGIIVQDLAVAAIARKAAPNLPLHGSTQMTVADLDGVRFLERLGFTQAVLAREVSLDEIREICSHTTMAIEVFIHGASCMSYSGQCLMSSFIGGRSGNRGACAQPCRLPYNLTKDGSPLLKEDVYILSLKDLNSLEYIDALMDAGVSSFKIEGRMKGLGYVRSVVQAYRRIMDSHCRSAQERKDAMAEATQLTAESFNRTYQHDFLAGTVGRRTLTEQGGGNQGRRVGVASAYRDNVVDAVLDEPLAAGDMIKIIAPDGRECIDEVRSAVGTFSNKKQFALEMRRSDLLTGTIYRLARKEDRQSHAERLQRRIALYCHVDADGEGRLRLTGWDEGGHTADIVSDYIVQKAKKRPATAEWVKSQLDRLGDTPFTLADAAIWDETYMIPASVLNELRRQCVDTLTEEILAEYVRPSAGTPSDDCFVQASDNGQRIPLSIAVRCDSIDAVQAAADSGADRVIFGGESYHHRSFSAAQWLEAVRIAHERGVSLWAATPRVVSQRHNGLVRRELEQALQSGADGVYAGSMSVFSMLRDMGAHIPVYADWSLNIFNSAAAGEYVRLGCAGITVSAEATLRQIGKIAEAVRCPVEAVIAGRLEMMITESCAVAAFAGTGRKTGCSAPCMKGGFALEDRRNEQFPVVTDQYCRSHILNSKELDMVPYFNELKRAGISVLRIEGRGCSPDWIGRTTKQYVRLCDGLETMVFGKEDRGVTRGHFFRGIL